MRLFYLFLSCYIIFLSSCIGDDFIFDTIDSVLTITDAPDSIAVNSTYTLRARYLNDIGAEEDVDLTWLSRNPEIISINNNGIATALETGGSTIVVEYDLDTLVLRDSVEIGVGEETIVVVQDRTGTVNTTSTYPLTGDFTLSEIANGVQLAFSSNYNADTSLPGLYVYLSNNPNSVASAHEIGPVQIFSGAHSYDISGVSIAQYDYVVYYCKPFNVKVGHGDIN